MMTFIKSQVVTVSLADDFTSKNLTTLLLTSSYCKMRDRRNLLSGSKTKPFANPQPSFLNTTEANRMTYLIDQQRVKSKILRSKSQE
jgi:hypothetical protein